MFNVLPIVLALACMGVSGWAGYKIRDADAQREENARVAQQRHDEQANRVLAHQASTDYEGAKAAAQQRFKEGQHAFTASLQTPTAPGCPALSDLPVPAATLAGLRDAWGGGNAERAASSEPGQAVRGAGDPVRREDRDGR